MRDLGRGASFNGEIKMAYVDYGDTSETALFRLPPESRVIGVNVDVETAFTGGTATLDVGISTDADYFVDGLSLAATGHIAVTLLHGSIDLGSRPAEVTVSVGAGNTAGVCRVGIVYVCATHAHLH